MEKRQKQQQWTTYNFACNLFSKSRENLDEDVVLCLESLAIKTALKNSRAFLDLKWNWWLNKNIWGYRSFESG